MTSSFFLLIDFVTISLCFTVITDNFSDEEDPPRAIVVQKLQEESDTEKNAENMSAMNENRIQVKVSY